MLDTVILNLPRYAFRITMPERFSPFATLLDQPGHYLIRCVNNPTREEKESGFYYPRLTLIKRPSKRAFDIWLKIEFSAPKVIFNNNVDELSEGDFEEVVNTLRQRLLHMGVIVETERLKLAGVSAFHASKNIPLNGGYTASYVIKELQKINLTKKLDLNKADFRNEGESVQYYANSHAFVMYDKLRDLGKKRGRAIDKDCTAIQLDLLARIKTNNPASEIIRLEARLCRKPKMNATLTKLGYRPNPTFEDIFRKKLCRKIIENYWREIIDKNAFLFDASAGPQKTLRAVFKKNPHLHPKQAIFLTGLAVLSRDQEGIRNMRAIIEEYADKRTWSRIARNFLILNSLNTYVNPAEWVNQISKSIQEFNPYRTIHYEERTNSGRKIHDSRPAAYREPIP